MKNSRSARVRMRAHIILLSSEGFGIDQIGHIYNIDRDSVSSRIDEWEQRGREGRVQFKTVGKSEKSFKFL